MIDFFQHFATAIFSLFFAVFPMQAPASGGGPDTLTQLSPWTQTATTVRLASTTAKLRIPGLTNCDTIDTDASGVFTCGVDSGGGAAGFSTTSNDYWKTQRDFFSTTSAIYFVHSSTTIPKTYTANTFTANQTFGYASSTGFSTSYASTSLFYANGLGGCAVGQYLTWSNGAFGCATDQNTGTGGSGAATTSFAATYPVTLTTSASAITYGFNGLTTSTPWTNGQVAYVSSGNQLTSVATGTVSAGSSAITVTAGRAVIGGALAIDCATAGSGQNGCLSSTDWSTFNNKLSSYDAWLHLSNFATTTSATNTSIWTQGAFFSSSTKAASQFPYASSTAFTVGSLFSTNATTTSLAITNLQNCDTIDTDGNGILKCGTDATGGSASWPFTSGTTFGTTTVATTSSIWTQGVYFSSSTVAASQFPYASSTAFTAGNLFATNLTLTNPLPIASGGTNNNAFNTGGLIFYDGSKLNQSVSLSPFYDQSNDRLIVGNTSGNFRLTLNRGNSPGSGPFGINSTGRSDGNIFIIDANNNVGIATTTPAAALGIQGNQFIAGNITSTSTLASIFPYASSTSLTVGNLFVTNATTTSFYSATASTSVFYGAQLSSCTGSGNKLTWASGTFRCEADQTGAGSSPGGADTQIQFNDGGVFNGNAALTFNKTTKNFTYDGADTGTFSALTLGGNDGFYADNTGVTQVIGRSLTLQGTSSVQIISDTQPLAITTEGGNAAGLSTIALTGNRTFSFPDFSGTIAVATSTLEAPSFVATSTARNFLPYASTTALTVSGEFYGPTYPSFTYATGTWTGSTTIPLGPAFNAETWTNVKCFTDAGTLDVMFKNNSSYMGKFNASTTVGNVTLTTNNAFTPSNKRYAEIGNPASSPTKISCTIKKTYP